VSIQVRAIDKGLCPGQYLLVGLSSVTIDDEMGVYRYLYSVHGYKLFLERQALMTTMAQLPS
jgi:hypothetical protein